MSPSSHVFLWRHRVIVTLLDYFWRSAGRGGWGFTWERREREWEKVVLYFLTKKLVYLDGMRTPDSLMHWQSNSLSKSFPEWEMMMCCTSVKMHRMFVKYKVISRVVVSMFIKKSCNIQSSRDYFLPLLPWQKWNILSPFLLEVEEVAKATSFFRECLLSDKYIGTWL